MEDPLFAGIPDGPINEVVVTSDDQRNWTLWQMFRKEFLIVRPRGTLMELASDAQMGFDHRVY